MGRPPSCSMAGATPSCHGITGVAIRVTPHGPPSVLILCVICCLLVEFTGLAATREKLKGGTKSVSSARGLLGKVSRPLGRTRPNHSGMKFGGAGDSGPLRIASRATGISWPRFSSAYASRGGNQLRQGLSKRRAHPTWAKPYACNLRVTRTEKGLCSVSRLMLRLGCISHVSVEALIEDGGYVLRAQHGLFSSALG